MSSPNQNRSPEDDVVFAAYGRAMHGAQALEHWLRILVNVQRIRSKEFASQAELEQAIENLSTSTMGTVFSALRELVRDPGLEERLTEAVAERNRLAHKFFGEWSEAWVGAETDLRMVEDADRVRELFERAVAELVSTLGKALDTIGLDPDGHIPGLQERIDKQLRSIDASTS